MASLVMDQLSALNLVKEEIESTLSQGIALLEGYAQTPDEYAALEHAITHFEQARGVLAMVNLDGGHQLITEVIALVSCFTDARPTKKAIDEGLQGISYGLIHLLRYMEFVQARKQQIPVFLLPSINQIRKAMGKPPWTESELAEISWSWPASTMTWPKSLGPPATDFTSVQQKAKRLRHMFQVGMLGVFNGEQHGVNLKIMMRATHRMIGLCGRTEMGLFWLTVNGLLLAFTHSQMPLSESRKILLGKLDRVMKRFLASDEGLSWRVEDDLMQACLVPIGLSTADDPLVQQIKRIYQVKLPWDEGHLLEALTALGGPSGSVIESATQAILDDLAQVKDQLDLATRGAITAQSFEASVQLTERIAHAAAMLNQGALAELLKQQAKVIEAWSRREDPIDAAAYEQIADALLSVENTLSKLRSNSSVYGLKGQPPVNAKLSRTELEQAGHLVVVESRVGIAVAKRAIASYIDSHCDELHLANIPASVATIGGALRFLHLDRAARVISQCGAFIQEVLIGGVKQPSTHQLEMLADALTGVDYFLEGLEASKPIGEGILEVAEDSIEELSALSSSASR